jgi:hypothetical protein
MEAKDIIGKEFICFEFKDDDHLNYNEKSEFLGLTAVVKNIHITYPQYARVTLTDKEGRKREPHYPVAMILKQLNELEKEEEAQSIDDIIIEMKQLISRI